MMEIGGYFELQMFEKEHYYPELIHLNSGRSCLEYILRAGRYTKIYLPYYICKVVFEPIYIQGTDIEFYAVNEDLTIKDQIDLKETEALLYVNYFGLMDEYITTLTGKYGNLIIDNVQAFFSKPIAGAITYYSPRKFFGVSDGGYLSTKTFIDFNLNQGTSYQNANFLLARLDAGAEAGYQNFRVNEDQLDHTGLRLMSKLTSTILSSLDYESIRLKREQNFKIIHQELGIHNQFKIIRDNIPGPMTYPFLIQKPGLREFLISKKVFIPKYWDNVTQMRQENSFESLLANQLVALPIDQRYGSTEMVYLVELVKSYCKF